ncbi:MAG: PEP-CTERM sorting domain-containing protein [Acidobacteriota bacterium]|nr:PEP-CTERM sorting domain-containing protein [Acidobacteriota bacterium]
MLVKSKLVFVLALCAFSFVTSPPAYADAVQLTSVSQLNPADVTAAFPPGTPIPGTSATILPNPLVIAAGGNTLTFTKPSGLFVISTIFPGQLSTGNAFGQGSAPITITFATGVGELGFLARPNFTGPPGFSFTFTAFNGSTALRTFSVGTFGLVGSAFVGVRATDGDVITSLVVNHTIPDFAIGPVTFGPAAPSTAVPEPATLLLLATGLAGVAAKVRKRRNR